MRIESIIDGILAYHPSIGEGRSCDVAIGGDSTAECTGIVVSIAPTVDVIRNAIATGANFILVHEPTFYSGYDDACEWLKGNEVYEEKRSLLVDNGIVVYRDHDHIHAHRPDGIFHYVLKQLGWLEYEVPSAGYGFEVKLAETTLGRVVLHVKQAMGLQTIRYIGDLGVRVSSVGFCGHLFPNERTDWSNNDQVAASWKYDIVIPGETVDWTLPFYIRDSAMLGRTKGMILPGHFVQEEAGMRWATEWLRPIVGNSLPIAFQSAGDMFSYL